MTVFTGTSLLKGKLSAGQFSHQILPVSVFTIKRVSTMINRKETCNMLASFHCDKFFFFLAVPQSIWGLSSPIRD